jgi:hypothetical protein
MIEVFNEDCTRSAVWLNDPARQRAYAVFQICFAAAARRAQFANGRIFVIGAPFI